MSMVSVALLPRQRQALAENWWKLAHGVAVAYLGQGLGGVCGWKIQLGVWGAL